MTFFAYVFLLLINSWAPKSTGEFVKETGKLEPLNNLDKKKVKTYLLFKTLLLYIPFFNIRF